MPSRDDHRVTVTVQQTKDMQHSHARLVYIYPTPKKGPRTSPATLIGLTLQQPLIIKSCPDAAKVERLVIIGASANILPTQFPVGTRQGWC
jgi:hypothetical protein